MNIPNPNNSWAQIELFRCQYGVLPNPNDTRKINIETALRNIAKGIEEGCKMGNTSNMISPSNLCSVLIYLADNFEFES